MPALLVYIRPNMEPAKSRHKPTNSTPLLLRRGHLAIRISAYFLIASTAWVVFSDTLIDRLAARLPFLTAIQISKGLTYTIVMSALLYIMLRRWENRLRAAAARETHMTEALADAITAMMKLRDPFTSWHTNRTVEFSAQLGQALALAQEELATLVLAARLHDIGNTGIPTEILNRPGPLSPPERALVQTHVHIAYEMMNQAGVPAPAPEIVLQHHERLDGSGYPRRIRGEGIALDGAHPGCRRCRHRHGLPPPSPSGPRPRGHRRRAQGTARHPLRCHRRRCLPAAAGRRLDRAGRCLTLRAALARPPFLGMIHPLCRDGGIGRRKGLKIPRACACAGSSPAPGTRSPIGREGS